MSRPLLLIFRAVLKQSLFDFQTRDEKSQANPRLCSFIVSFPNERWDCAISGVRSEADAHWMQLTGSMLTAAAWLSVRLDDTVTSSSPCFPQRCLSGTKQTQTAWINWWHSGGCQVSCLNTVMVGRSPVVVRFILFPGQTFLSFCFETENVRSSAVVFQFRHRFSNSGKDVLS